MANKKIILAFVGMPGSGKSEAVLYLGKKGTPFVRFGQITDEGLKKLGLPLTSENERGFRENIRKEFGMAAYAIKSKPKIDELLKTTDLLAIDGLYSWEEYTYLKNEYSGLLLIHVFTERKKRYERLSTRAIRPIPLEKCFARDVSEIEKLNKGGPIAMADYLAENNSDSLEDLYQRIDKVLEKIKNK
ncbi:MAG: AAA family ATPase [bacterium]|nr:AAA family ATPase [bacterium]